MADATVVYHGHCFDGMASAAYLTRYLREAHAIRSFEYCGLDHQPGGSFVPEDVLTSALNAVVDFRYTVSPKLTWYFDHHDTGVREDEAPHLAADTSGRKFFEPRYSSCCLLLRDRLRERFGYEAPDLATLVAWADRIDAARFESAAEAIDTSPAALQLMTVLEFHGTSEFTSPRIEALSRGMSVDEIAGDPTIADLYAPLRESHERARTLFEQRAENRDGVVFADLVDLGTDRYNKFIPYALFPDAGYAVTVTRGASRAKVSVGANPWAASRPLHHVARLCERYGGGGHPTVGAVSFRPTQLAEARKAATEIVAVLGEPPSGA